MDPHPLSARAVAALLVLGACGDDRAPGGEPETVEVAALPGISTKNIDVAIVVATADPARFAAALPALLGPTNTAAGGGYFRAAVIGGDGAQAKVVSASGDDFTQILDAVAAVPPSTGGAVLEAMRSALATPGFRRFDGEVVEIIAADADDASAEELADVARVLGAADTRFAAVVVAPPSPRWSAFAAAFGPHGARVSSPADLAIAGPAVQQVSGLACLDATGLLDAGLEGGLQPLCYATEQRGDVVADLPECPHEGDCFAVIHDDYACPHVPDYLRVSINFTVAPTPSTSARVRCELP